MTAGRDAGARPDSGTRADARRHRHHPHLPGPPLPTAGDLELGHEHRAGTGTPVPAGRCPVLLRRLARTGWAPNLVAAAPFFLSPKAGGPRDLAGALIAVLVFVLAQELAPRLLASDSAKSRESALLAAALLVGSVAVGHGMATAAAVFLVLEAVRLSLRRVPDRWSRCSPPAAWSSASTPARRCSGPSWPRPCWRPASCSACCWRSRPRHPPAAPACGASWPRSPSWPILALYVAGLTADPWVQRTGGVWPLLSVPLVLLGLVQLWQGRRQAGGPDARLAATGVAWAVLMCAVLPAGGL